MLTPVCVIIAPNNINNSFTNNISMMINNK